MENCFNCGKFVGYNPDHLWEKVRALYSAEEWDKLPESEKKKILEGAGYREVACSKCAIQVV